MDFFSCVWLTRLVAFRTYNLIVSLAYLCVLTLSLLVAFFIVFCLLFHFKTCSTNFFYPFLSTVSLWTYFFSFFASLNSSLQCSDVFLFPPFSLEVVLTIQPSKHGYLVDLLSGIRRMCPILSKSLVSNFPFD